MAPDLSRPISDPEELRPSTRVRFYRARARAEDQIKLAGFGFLTVETYRLPARQAWLYGSGRSRPGPILTNDPGPIAPHPDRRAADWTLVNPAGTTIWYSTEKSTPEERALFLLVATIFESEGFISGIRFRDRKGQLDRFGFGWDTGHVEDAP